MSTVHEWSEYLFATQYKEPDTGDLMFTDPVVIGFQALEDNTPYQVVEGDTLWGIAARAYQGLPRPARFWRVLMDFNEIYDPTVPLEPHSTLWLPSIRTIYDTYFSNDRYQEVDPAVL
jgi:hypothetical protein